MLLQKSRMKTVGDVLHCQVKLLILFRIEIVEIGCAITVLAVFAELEVAHISHQTAAVKHTASNQEARPTKIPSVLLCHRNSIASVSSSLNAITWKTNHSAIDTQKPMIMDVI